MLRHKRGFVYRLLRWRMRPLAEQPPHFELRSAEAPLSWHSSDDFPFGWQRIKACPLYPDFLMVRGDYGLRLNRDADEDDRGGRTAWEVWHWPSNTVESDWFTAADAWREIGELHAA